MKSKTVIKNRVRWGFNPASRVVPSAKLYCRKKEKTRLRRMLANER